MARLTRAAINRLQHIRSGIPENYRVLFTDARAAHKGQRTPGDDEPVMDEELTIAGLERSSGGLPVPLLLRIEGAEQEVGTSEGTGFVWRDGREQILLRLKLYELLLNMRRC